MRCIRIVSGSICNWSPDSDSEKSLKIGQYLTKLKRTKQSVPVFGHPVLSVGIKHSLRDLLSNVSNYD